MKCLNNCKVLLFKNANALMHLESSLAFLLGSNFAYSATSSAAVSIPEKIVHADDISKGLEISQEDYKSCPKKELLRTCFEKERKHPGLSKSKMTEQHMTEKLLKASTKGCKNHESRKITSGTSNQASSRKQLRKVDSPIRLPSAIELSQDAGCPDSWICKNSACRASLTADDTFCKRCSCCICHLFDDNKDPSLWLVCTSETNERDSCGLSCHIECALQCQKVGVVNLGQLMQLDGSYCCASCGKVSGIIG